MMINVNIENAITFKIITADKIIGINMLVQTIC